MPTRVCAGVGDYPRFLTFITIVPIDCKITTGFELGFWGGKSLTFMICT